MAISLETFNFDAVVVTSKPYDNYLTSPRSIEACRVEGVRPSDLVRRPDSFFTPVEIEAGRAGARATVRIDARTLAERYEVRRVDLLALVRARRAKATLSPRASRSSPRKNGAGGAPAVVVAGAQAGGERGMIEREKAHFAKLQKRQRIDNEKRAALERERAKQEAKQEAKRRKDEAMKRKRESEKAQRKRDASEFQKRRLAQLRDQEIAAEKERRRQQIIDLAAEKRLAAREAAREATHKKKLAEERQRAAEKRSRLERRARERQQALEAQAEQARRDAAHAERARNERNAAKRRAAAHEIAVKQAAQLERMRKARDAAERAEKEKVAAMARRERVAELRRKAFERKRDAVARAHAVELDAKKVRVRAAQEARGREIAARKDELRAAERATTARLRGRSARRSKELKQREADAKARAEHIREKRARADAVLQQKIQRTIDESARKAQALARVERKRAADVEARRQAQALLDLDRKESLARLRRKEKYKHEQVILQIEMDEKRRKAMLLKKKAMLKRREEFKKKARLERELNTRAQAKASPTKRSGGGGGGLGDTGELLDELEQQFRADPVAPREQRREQRRNRTPKKSKAKRDAEAAAAEAAELARLTAMAAPRAVVVHGSSGGVGGSAEGSRRPATSTPGARSSRRRSPTKSGARVRGSSPTKGGRPQTAAPVPRGGAGRRKGGKRGGKKGGPRATGGLGATAPPHARALARKERFAHMTEDKLSMLRKEQNEKLLDVLKQEQRAEKNRERQITRLEKMSDRSALERIYNVDRQKASKRIMRVTAMHEAELESAKAALAKADRGGGDFAGAGPEVDDAIMRQDEEALAWSATQ